MAGHFYQPQTHGMCYWSVTGAIPAVELVLLAQVLRPHLPLFQTDGDSFYGILKPSPELKQIFALTCGQMFAPPLFETAAELTSACFKSMATAFTRSAPLGGRQFSICLLQISSHIVATIVFWHPQHFPYFGYTSGVRGTAAEHPRSYPMPAYSSLHSYSGCISLGRCDADPKHVWLCFPCNSE